MSAFDGPSRSSTSTILRALRSISDLSPFSYPKSIASVALIIYEALRESNANKLDAERLSTRVMEVAWTLSSSLADAGTSPSGDLARSVGQLLRALEGIANRIRRQSSRCITTRFLRITKNSGDVRLLEEDLERSISLFQFQTRLANINLSKRLMGTEDDLDGQVESLLEASRQEKKEMFTNSPLPLKDISPKIVSASKQVLPPPPQVFFGRTSYVDRVVEQVTRDAQSRVAILGAGGMGKTSVALAAIHDSRVVSIYQSRRHFIACESVSDASCLISSLLESFDITTPSDFETLVSFLSRQTSRTLLVLDNLETPWESPANRQEVEYVLETLSDIPGISLLITMRGAERPSSVVWSRPFLPQLPCLDPQSSKEAFTAISGTSEDDDDLPTLLEALDHVPLAVTLMANLAQYSSCAALLARWGEEKTTMLTRGLEDRLSNLDISIQVSLSSERLKGAPQAFSALQTLSQFPDGASRKELESAMSPSTNIHAAVSALLQVALIQYDSSDRLRVRLRVLSPIREHVKMYFPLDNC
ncbi:hypothetical protein SISNIDRAFT_550287 [Sistotremastrum niveocremeum HHB9708]|uniref:Novel STAND NTPase 1 domain-containing protein n=1 Tax=Sistotremastrum niveocremeum HHB9708 TaxID=1314777 RepID=A0A164TY66_9AGAM|nr:hypothetical protein SISNIDRAFT_550287 [Sistotremastrum niveocremeum HHB9708]